jgi:phosphoglycolate phosphatase
MAIKAILFDKDGTLIDFDATWGPAAYEVMRALSRGDAIKLARLVAVSEYDLATRSFRPTSPLVAGSSAEYGPLWAVALDREPGEPLYTEMDDLFRHWGLRHLAPIGDPAAILSGLALAGLKLGIATNDAEASARAQANAMGIDAMLDFIAGYDSGFGGKPDPGMVTAFVDHHRLQPDEVALVGDSLHDLIAAHNAGVIAIAVLTGPLGEAARPQVEPYADYVIGSIADLPAWLAADQTASLERVRPSPMGAVHA